MSFPAGVFDYSDAFKEAPDGLSSSISNLMRKSEGVLMLFAVSLAAV